MTFLRMSDIDLKDKRVLIREDLNVPLNDDGSIAASQRLEAALPTLRAARDAGARVMVASHLGRPDEGVFDESASLEPVAQWLSDALEVPVPLKRDWLDGVEVEPGQIVLLENVRFNLGEKSDDEGLAKAYANLCDVFVMDAFGTAHRAQASTHGVAKFATEACAGPLLAKELDALEKALATPARPMVALVGGSKVSSKLTVLDALSKIADVLVVGGGISNTFVASTGREVGNSLVEKDLIPEATRLRESTQVIFAEDVRVTKDGFKQWSDTSATEVKSVDDIAADEEIIDYGPKTAEKVAEILKNAKTILWNV